MNEGPEDTSSSTSGAVSKKTKLTEKEQNQKSLSLETNETQEQFTMSETQKKLSIATSDNRDTQEGSDKLSTLLSQGQDINEFGLLGIQLNSWKTIQEQLKNEDDAIQMQGLINLCDKLSYLTEDNMSGFPLDDFLSHISRLLAADFNPSLVLYACRSLDYLLEALPAAALAIPKHNILSQVCAKVLNIEYDDLRSQAMAVLRKFCDVPQNCAKVMRAGGLEAVLSNLDFCPIESQYLSLKIAAKILKNIPSDCWDQVVNAVPILSMLLQYSDEKLVEKACECLDFILKDSQKDLESLKMLKEHDVVTNLVRLITLGAESRHLEAKFGDIGWAIKCLESICDNWPSVIEQLLLLDLHQALKVLLSQVASTPDASKKLQFDLDLLSLIDQMLPRLSQRMSKLLQTPVSSTPLQRALRLGKRNFRSKTKSRESNEKVDPRIDLYKKQPHWLEQLSQAFLPPLLTLYESRSNDKCLTVIIKIIGASSSENLNVALNDLNFTRFVADLVSSKDLNITRVGLYLCEQLMIKLPIVYMENFVREGVFVEIERTLKELENLNPNFAPLNTLESSDPKSGENTPLTPLQKSEIPLSSPSFVSVLTSPSSLKKTESVSLNRLSPHVDQKIKKATIKEAKQFLETYGVSEKLGSTRLDQICTISNNLRTFADKLLPESFGELEDRISDIANLLAPEFSLSTFEFINSDLCGSILYFFLNEYQSPSETKYTDSKARAFVSVFYKNNGSKLKCLIRELHHILDKLEPFGSSSRNSEVSPLTIEHALRFLQQTIPFQIECDPNETHLSKLSLVSIEIQPFATVNTIKSYLRDRLRRELTAEDSKNNRDGSPQEDEIELNTGADSEVHFSQQNEVDENQFSSTVQVDNDEEYDGGYSENSSDSKIGKIYLTLNGVELKDNEEPIFKSVRRIFPNEDLHGTQLLRNLFEKSYKLQYSSVSTEKQQQESSQYPKFDLNMIKKSPLEQFLSNLQVYIFTSIPCDPLISQVLSLLQLLKYLDEHLHFYSDRTDCISRISENEFINQKLSMHLWFQLQDPLTASTESLPRWCRLLASDCRFLFTKDVLQLYFKSSFGMVRALHALDSVQSNPIIQLNRIPRQKVGIPRKQLLCAAFKVLDLVEDSRSILEVGYHNEIGTGLGPTLEFYSLVSLEFQRADLGMWVVEKINLISKTDNKSFLDVSDSRDKSLALIYNSGGLFPVPVPKEKCRPEYLNLFHHLGIFLAKALLDERLIDIPFSNAFYKKLLGKPLNSKDLEEVHSSLITPIQSWINILKKKHQINAQNLSPSEKELALSSIDNYCGGKIESMYLYFELPGYGNIVPEGSEKLLTIENLDEYVDLVLEVIANSGIEAQFDALKVGFERVFPLELLKLFSETELENLLLGSLEEQNWDYEIIKENTRCSLGYTHNSKVVIWIISLIVEFDTQQRRDFLQFVTGSPRLPVRGFRGFPNKLTFVRKVSDPGKSPDDYFPSVNTCFLYLKIPEYSSKGILKEKLLFAMKHGQQGFSLS